MKMGKCSRKDYISDLPESIIDSILTKLPTRDAVKTSILSTKWRYRWASMTQLDFSEDRMCLADGKKISGREFGSFIMRFLFLHHGPILKFKLFTSSLENFTDIDQWLLFLSRKDIKELVLKLYKSYGYNRGYNRQLPSCIFSCQKLTTLELLGFDVIPHVGFQGFPCLKYLNLSAGPLAPFPDHEVIENLISACPLLEKFIITNIADPLALAIYSPNLKHLTVIGRFTNLCIQHTPLLVSLSISFSQQAWESYIRVKVPVTYDCLKFIHLKKINYEEMLHLILQSPNLQELTIVASTIKNSHDKAADLDFWEKECPTDFTFKHLKLVEMSGVTNKNYCVGFLRFLLGRSPVLEVLSVSPHEVYKGKMNMANEVLHFQRASPKVDIRFFD